MSNKLVIGAGACGFLRMNHLLNSVGIRTKYKGGKVKFQNGFETWNSQTGLVWKTEILSESDKYNRAKVYFDSLGGATDIGHYPLKYTKELISIDSNIKILCIKPTDREHSIMSLFTQWAYRNPVATKRGEYRARYVLEQFPDYSHLTYLNATTAYWEEYYAIAEKLQQQYPNNFLILESSGLFEPETDNYETRKTLANFFDNQGIIGAKHYPINKEKLLTATLHGGLGNNLFQMGEAVAFAAQHNLPKPVFGTWKLQGGGGLFPPTYNADAFLGKHTGTHQDFMSAFSNVDWRTENEPTFDVKFMINDMFDFSRVNHMREEMLETFKPSKEIIGYIMEKYGDLYKGETVSLHLRTCTLAADDHVNGTIPVEFHKQALGALSDDTRVLVFSDNNGIAKSYIEEMKKFSNKEFHLIDENQFKSIFMMSICKHHILHVSTMSFWGAYLDTKQEGKTFYHVNFDKCHTDRMISGELGWIKIEN